jgi:hypothetical protein
MAPISTRAAGESSTRRGSVKGFVQVMLEFFIGEFSCLITTPDQVFTRFGLGVESVEQRSQASADSIANNRIADLSADRVRHGNGTGLRVLFDETDSK